MFFAELAHPDFKQYDLSSLRTGIMAGSLSFRADEKGANRNAFSRNGNWLRHDRNQSAALKPDTMRHLTKELVQWVEFYHIQK
jgi:hypothetical protein